MSQPTTYNRQVSFTLRAAEDPDQPYTGAELDQEFNALKVTLDQVLANMALLQRDDGELANNSVSIDQISGDLGLEFEAPDFWTTATEYQLFSTVWHSSAFYKCEVAHTSGTFATDLSAGKWELIANFADLVIAADSVTTAMIQDSAVTTVKINSGAVTEDKLGPLSVTNGKLGLQAVDTQQLADGAVTPDKIEALAVTTAKIALLAIDATLLATDAVITAKIQDEAVTLAKLAQEVIDAMDVGGIADNSVTYAKMQNVTATNRVIGRSTAGAGDPEEIPCTAQGRALIAGADAAANRTTLGLGTSSTKDTGVSLTTVALGAVMPVGGIIEFGGTSAPTGWLLCYGQAVSRTTYAALFTAIGTVHGAGDDSTTFNVPDHRGRVVAGKDDMGGSSANRLTGLTGGVNGDTMAGTGGEESHTLTTAELAAHDHSYTLKNTSVSLQEGVGSSTNGLWRNTTSASSGSTGGGGAHNNVQPTIIQTKIIYAGV